MILNLYKKDTDGSSIKTEVFGGNFSFDYLPELKKLYVHINNGVCEYKVRDVSDINIGLHGYIVDAFIDEEDKFDAKDTNDDDYDWTDNTFEEELEK